MPQDVFEGKKIDNARSSSRCNANAKIRPAEYRYGTFYYQSPVFLNSEILILNSET